MKKRERIEKLLNLEPIMIKAMDSEEGRGWDFPLTRRIAAEYRRFWILCLENPEEAVVPSNLVDDFWHLHILDTQKYAEDCAQFLGFFLHHFPYFGMRGEKDAQNLADSWARTKLLYKQTFGESPPPDLWPHANRCPRCGRRVNNEIAMESRPVLADLGLIQ